MLKSLTIVLLYILISSYSGAQESWLLGRLSPEFNKFMREHPAALKVLTNSFSEGFSNRSAHVFYFYSTNASEARAAHFYPNTAGMPDVIICVRENQDPMDQFITLLFETLNSRGEARFKKLFEDAKAGSVSREVFAQGVIRTEFEATLNTRALLIPLRFSKREIRKSGYYNLFAECPTNYEAFRAYSKLVSTRDALKEYEEQYDALRKSVETTDKQAVTQ